ncbi:MULTISPECIES: DUF3592 domain-containing protein [Streptomyces]|uniref:DUF3592 domain-containing protein n=1 Tax=Streptomyces TaxID=1883 RepID=UPI0016701A79|nr:MULTISPECIES: DUF3592 domain-containing protein [Streptomyces]UFR00250.1 DUF3592 domain-containing protein [Streptomyces sp. Go40/10]GGS80981.1 hypothetical protein GCM10010206_49480 [Streptomyces cinerochromogenes]
MGGLIGAGVPLLLGTVFMAVGLGLRRRTRRLRQQGAKARGTVVRFHTRRDVDSHSTMYSPVVQWVTGDGRTVEAVSPIARNTVGDLRAGAAVTVFYDPDNPKRMLVDGHDGAALAVVFCVVGTVGLAAGLLVVGFLVA